MLLSYLFPRSEKVEKLYALSVSDFLTKLPPNHSQEADTITLFEYAHPLVQSLVWEVKYKGSKKLAEKMGIILYDTLIQELSEKNFHEKYPVLLIPMPTSDKRRLERGWNQCEILTKAIKKCDTGNVFEYLPGVLVKTRYTESQTKATRSERLENLQDSMAVSNPNLVKDECVVVVDDVITTGGTFAEAKRALHQAGAKRVFCIALAH